MSDIENEGMSEESSDYVPSDEPDVEDDSNDSDVSRRSGKKGRRGASRVGYDSGPEDSGYTTGGYTTGMHWTCVLQLFHTYPC